MTTSTDRLHATSVSRAVVRAILDDASARGYGPGVDDSTGVVGVFGDPAATDPALFEHRGVPVRVAPCVSALAVREELLAHSGDTWLAIVTDRSEEDLGSGILAHFAGHKLRTPNPWEAVRQQFAATGLEPALHADRAGRSLAHGLLLAQPESGWPPAPAGALTRDHALGAVAQAHLSLRSRSLDLLGVLQWTVTPDVTSRIAQLRALAGDELADATVEWICDSAGSAAPVVTHLVQSGEVRGVLPMSLVLGLLADAGPDGQLGLARLSHRWGGSAAQTSTLSTLGAAAGQVMATMVRDRAQRADARTLVSAADALLVEGDAVPLAVRSGFLPSGLTGRLHELGRQVSAALRGEPSADVEAAWTEVSSHLLADPDHTDRPDPRLRPMAAAVRLVRWLAADDSDSDTGATTATSSAPTRSGPGDSAASAITRAHGVLAGSATSGAPAGSAGSLASLALRQSRVDAWVDNAVNDVHEGVADPELAQVLNELLAKVQVRRDDHDRHFADVLAAATRHGEGTAEGFLSDGPDKVWLLEHLLAKVVVPLAKQTQVLFLLLDGMSTGVSTEIVDDILGRNEGWNEALLPGATHRAAGLAVLPTLTAVSRASLFCGELTTGGQDREQRGYRALTNAHGLGSFALIHKKPLDSTQPGYAVSDDVAHAIMDPGQRLVSCVLNTIDDALDRSDPAGTEWTSDAVKHLRPLLDRALAAGRTVVLTADHGHVVERRAKDSAQRAYPEISSGRSRSAKPPADDDEVLVTGTRVLKHGGSAVFPRTERLRYAPLKAGYHGGATPAEVVVPLVVLVPGEDVPAGTGLTLAPRQEPTWWSSPSAAQDPATLEVVVPEAAPTRQKLSPPQDGPDLFADIPIEPAVTRSRPTTRVSLARAVLDSETFAMQRELSGRVTLTDEQVADALEALGAAPSARLPLDAVVATMSLPRARAQGALAQLQQLLNVEGYPVVRIEGRVVALDLSLLREQFALF